MEQIRVDMTPKGIKPVCHSSQYDKGRIIRLNLVDGIQGYTLTGEETLELEVRKPDNNIVTAEVQNTSSNYVLIVTTEQMTACEGDSNCEIRVRLGDTDIGSINFILRVEEDPLKDGIESETEIHNLHTQIEEINAEIIPGMVAEEVARQYTGDVIFDDEPTENHGDGYAVTSEGIKTAIDNAIGGLSIPDELNDLSDVDISGQALGEALVWDGTKWVNGTVSTVGNLDDLSDVDTTGKATGDSLRYNGLEWVAKPTTVKMTKAEYDAIVDFTPYANTHIVITDAPNLNATASDIEYSSGVTVADSLDSLNTATTPQSISGVTYNSTNINSGAFTCYKIGRLVMLDIAALQTKIAIGSNEEELLSGLPLPLVDTGRYSLFDGDGTARARVKVTTDGKLRMWHNPSNFTVGTGFYGNVYYISAS